MLVVCGGKLKLIAVIEEPAVVEKILKHIGLDPQPPPRAQARRVDLFEDMEAARASAGFYGAEAAARLWHTDRAKTDDVAPCMARDLPEFAG